MFVTGATGFVGRRVVSALAARESTRVVGFSRSSPRKDTPGSEDETAFRVTGDLLEPGAYERELGRCDVVLHLAACTGRAERRRYWRVNVDGTAALVEACRRAGVRRLIHVSTVAVHFENLDDYPYAASKAEGEAVVRKSGLDHVVVRPTLVLGRDGSGWRSLSSLARLPLLVVPGSGSAPVQPIHVEDVARVLADLACEEESTGGVHGIGGADVVSVEGLLGRIHRRLHGGGSPRVLHLPLRPLVAVVSLVDRLAPGRPPVAKGQLSTFHQDGRVRNRTLQTRYEDSLMEVDEIVERCLGRTRSTEAVRDDA